MNRVPTAVKAEGLPVELDSVEPFRLVERQPHAQPGALLPDALHAGHGGGDLRRQ